MTELATDLRTMGKEANGVMAEVKTKMANVDMDALEKKMKKGMIDGLISKFNTVPGMTPAMET